MAVKRLRDQSPGDLLDADGGPCPGQRQPAACGPSASPERWPAGGAPTARPTPWADLFDPAIALARDGYEPGGAAIGRPGPATGRGAQPRLSAAISRRQSHQAGARLRNPVLANSLEQLAAMGAFFYRGDLARQSEGTRRARDEPVRGWSQSVDHLKVIRREPSAVDGGASPAR